MKIFLNPSAVGWLMFVTFSLLSHDSRAAVLADWTFDSFSAGSAITSVGSTGSISGGVTFTTTTANSPTAVASALTSPPSVSAHSMAAQFNASQSDRLGSGSVVSSFNFGANQAFTIDGWINLSSVDANTRGIFSNRGSSTVGNAGFSVQVTNGQLQFFVDVGPTARSINSGTTLLSTNTWYYFAAMRTTDGQLQLYLGGATVGDSPTLVGTSGTNLIAGAFTTDNPTYIGATAQSISSSSVFDGSIGEIRVSDTALTSSEFLWTAVPEPNTELTVLAAMGLWLIFGRLRRQTKSLSLS